MSVGRPSTMTVVHYRESFRERHRTLGDCKKFRAVLPSDVGLAKGKESEGESAFDIIKFIKWCATRTT
jgi:hypothetical protein